MLTSANTKSNTLTYKTVNNKTKSNTLTLVSKQLLWYQQRFLLYLSVSNFYYYCKELCFKKIFTYKFNRKTHIYDNLLLTFENPRKFIKKRTNIFSYCSSLNNCHRFVVRRTSYYWLLRVGKLCHKSSSVMIREIDYVF